MGAMHGGFSVSKNTELAFGLLGAQLLFGNNSFRKITRIRGDTYQMAKGFKKDNENDRDNDGAEN